MKIILPGGTGQIGVLLARHFLKSDHELVILSRRPKGKAPIINSGTVKVASPHPLPNVELMRILRKALGVKLGLPAAKWMLKIGAVLMKTETELLLKNRRVVPGKLVEVGHRFQYPSWESACDDLAARSSYNP